MHNHVTNRHISNYYTKQWSLTQTYFYKMCLWPHMLVDPKKCYRDPTSRIWIQDHIGSQIRISYFEDRSTRILDTPAGSDEGSSDVIEPYLQIYCIDIQQILTTYILLFLSQKVFLPIGKKDPYAYICLENPVREYRMIISPLRDIS